MQLRFRFVGDVDERLKNELRPFARWLRGWYRFPVPLEIRLINQLELVDDDGTPCHLRWWQSSRGQEPVTGEIAVGRFPHNLKHDGPMVAYPTVVAAIGRLLKYYFQAIREAPRRTDFAERWGDRLLEAYTEGTRPPPAWKGAEYRRNGNAPGG